MSWDILIQDLPDGVASVAEIPDNFEPAAIGSRSDLIAAICEVAPGSDFSDPSWGEFATSEFVVEFNMGGDEIVHSIMLQVRGGGAATEFISGLLARLGRRAIDCSAGEFFHPATSSKSFADWQAFRDRVPEWRPDTTIESPAWLAEGARIVHATFGAGTIGRVGEYRDVPSVWIDFDDGQTKALALEFGLPHLSAEAPAPTGRRFGWRRR